MNKERLCSYFRVAQSLSTIEPVEPLNNVFCAKLTAGKEAVLPSPNWYQSIDVSLRVGSRTSDQSMKVLAHYYSGGRLSTQIFCVQDC